MPESADQHPVVRKPAIGATLAKRDPTRRKASSTARRRISGQPRLMAVTTASLARRRAIDRIPRMEETTRARCLAIVPRRTMVVAGTIRVIHIAAEATRAAITAVAVVAASTPVAVVEAFTVVAAEAAPTVAAAVVDTIVKLREV